MDLKSLYDAVVSGDKDSVEAGVRAALEAGVPAGQVLNQTLIPAMGEVGRLFEAQEFYVPEMLVSARAMQAGVALLKPHLTQAEVQSSGKVVIGTVKGDLHDIGKNLVTMMLEGAGFEVHDLGTDVSPDKFVEAAQTSSAEIVAMSALLTTTMPNMKATLDALEQAGLRGRVKVMVGGAPLTDAYARQIGADGYAPDASRAVKMAQSLVAR
ncbi:MAG TPA: corrinoid protein [Anaerolineae bacterium]|nr:corrinoid protein [Anaerolineae bacterium]